MQVIKRNGRREAVHFEKITNRLRKLCALEPPIPAADISRVAQHACAAVHDLITTETLDTITADAAVALSTEHPDYSHLAARILVSNLQKTTSADVVDVYDQLRDVVSQEFLELVFNHATELNSWLDFSRDFAFDYFGFKTLAKSYLLKHERPQHMYLRVALGIWGDDLGRARETYDALSTHQFTHASPTLFNAGTKTPQLASW
jgi:ribonucleotide reductase alpha subunit